DTSATTFSGAVFGQANYKVTNRLTLTAGLRYTYDDKHGITDTSDVGTPYSVTSLQFHYNVSAYSNNVSYLLSAAYKITDNSLFYASYSTGYKSPGLNLNAYVTP